MNTSTAAVAVSAFLVVAAASVAVAGCGAEVACTEEARAGLVITVENEDGDVVCDADVTAVDGDFQEDLEVSGEGSDCRYSGVYERDGDYTVQVNADGYVGGLFAGIRVRKTEDGCHVKTVEKTLQITHDEQ